MSGGAFRLVQILGGARNGTITTGSSSAFTPASDGVAATLRILNGTTDSTLSLIGGVMRVLMYGGVADSIVNVTGNAITFCATGGIGAGSDIVLNGGVRIASVVGGMDGGGFAVNGDVTKLTVAGPIKGSSTVSVNGNARCVRICEGIVGSSVKITGRADQLRVYGGVSGAGAAVQFGDVGAAYLAGQVTGSVTVSGDLAGAVYLRNGLASPGQIIVQGDFLGTIRSFADLTGNVIFDGNMSGFLGATLLGDVAVHGDFTGRIGGAYGQRGHGTLTVDSSTAEINGWLYVTGFGHVSVPAGDRFLGGALASVDDLNDANVKLNVADFMGWSACPAFATDVAYLSSDAWEDAQNLPVINYEPSHYPHFTNGKVTFADGTPLADTTFQQSLATDFPFYQQEGDAINYIQGEPQITIYHDLQQLKADGFKGVRLYASPPGVYIATILAAQQLGMKVYYEVAVPDLSEDAYANGTVPDREGALYADLVRQGGNGVSEGSLQCLHYVINAVGESVFSATVPLVFFTHENLVSPQDSSTTLTDDNCSVPLLRWGINAVRSLLQTELAGYSLPAVTTAILAGQVVQVSHEVYPEVEKLIQTIQKDTHAPIAYDVYPFQWGSRYFNVQHPYVNNPEFVIDNAYPPGSNWYDRCTVAGQDWASGPPPTDPTHTVAQTVTEADLMWSLQWTVDNVNWIWGGRTAGATTKQIIAETGWPSSQKYTDQGGRELTGSLADARQFFETVKLAGFQVGNCSVMYFSAFDEPIKESNAYPNMFSENHYGIYGWTGIPKFTTTTVANPLLERFVILSIAPGNMYQGFPQTMPGQTPSDTSYSYTVNAGTAVNVPWYWGSNTWSDNTGVNGRICYLPNPDILLSAGDTVVISSASHDADKPITSPITLKTNDGITVSYTDPDNKGTTGSNLTLISNQYGASWKLWLSFPWAHGGSNSFSDTANYKPVPADWWGE